MAAQSDTRNDQAPENTEALRPPPVDMTPGVLLGPVPSHSYRVCFSLSVVFAHWTRGTAGEDGVSTFLALVAILLALNSVVWWRSVSIARALRSSHP